MKTWLHQATTIGFNLGVCGVCSGERVGRCLKEFSSKLDSFQFSFFLSLSLCLSLSSFLSFTFTHNAKQICTKNWSENVFDTSWAVRWTCLFQIGQIQNPHNSNKKALALFFTNAETLALFREINRWKQIRTERGQLYHRDPNPGSAPCLPGYERRTLTFWMDLQAQE